MMQPVDIQRLHLRPLPPAAFGPVRRGFSFFRFPARCRERSARALITGRVGRGFSNHWKAAGRFFQGLEV